MKISELMEVASGGASTAGGMGTSPVAVGGMQRRGKKPRKVKSVNATDVDSFNLESKTSDTPLIKR